MPDTSDILKLRILICFLRAGEEGCTVTGLSKTLGVEKYTISRMLTVMEKEILVDRTEIRRPVLTEKGKKEALRYSERMDIALSHLMYEGVDMESAKKDAFYWALYNTNRTMDVIRDSKERFRVKYMLRGRQSFDGTLLCKIMRNGAYTFPFLFYGERIEKGSNLSVKNIDFEQPCVLTIQDGVGTIQIRLADNNVSETTKKPMEGKVKNIRYLDNETYISAELIGNVVSIPISVLRFVNIGTDVGQILHGSVCVKMIYSSGSGQKSETMAIFTILI